MTWDSVLDATSKKALYEKKVATPQPILDPTVAANLSNIKVRAGWIPIETQVTLAKANASNQAIDAVGKMAAQQAVDVQGTPEPSGVFEKLVWKPLKTASRWIQAGAEFIPETVHGAVAQVFDKNEDIDGWFISTKLGSMVKSAQGDIDPKTGQPVTAGEGWFIGEELLERQAERARRYRGTVNGSAFTVGRAAANTMFIPGSQPYNLFSGLVDGLIMLKTDPAGPITKAVKGYKTVKTLIPRLTAEQLSGLKAVLSADAGFIPGLSSVGLDATKYANFMNTNWRARKLVSKLRDEKDVVKIMDMLGQSPNVSNEMLALLAKAGTDDEVKTIFALGQEIGRGALTDEIRTLQVGRISSSARSVGGNILERTHLANSKFAKKTSTTVKKYLTAMPDSTMYIVGDRFQNANAARTIVNYLRTIGANDETVSKIGGQVIEAFTDTAIATDQYKALKAFERVVDTTLGQHGVAKDVRERVIQEAHEGVDNLRQYMNNREGVSTDNGLFKWKLGHGEGVNPGKQLETMIQALGSGDEMRVISPLQISELLKRMYVLPDVRELRRLTSNRFFGFGERVGSIAGKSSRMQITKIVDQDKYDELGELAETYRRGLIGLDEADDGVQELKNAMIATENERGALIETTTRRVRTGEERAALHAINVIQNQVWKPWALMTGGYIVRNSLDAQVRMAFSSLPSVFTHPVEYIYLVLGTSKRSTLKGELLTGLKLEEYVDDVREAMTFGLRQQGFSAKDVFDHQIKTNDWSIVGRDDIRGIEFHADAVSQNGTLVHGDPLQRVAAETFVAFGGATTEAKRVAIARIVAIIKDPEDTKIYDAIRRNYAGGLEVVVPDGTHAKLPPINFAELSPQAIDDHLYAFATRVPVANADMLTGNIPDIQFAYAFNSIPLRDSVGNVADLVRMSATDASGIVDEGKVLRVGSAVTIETPSGRVKGVVVRAVDGEGERITTLTAENIDEAVVEIQPVISKVTDDGVKTTTAFGGIGTGSHEFRNIVRATPLWDGTKGLPAKLKRERLSTELKTDTWRKSQDRVTNWFFGRLYGSITRKLERSPVFREFYYREVGRYYKELSPEGAQAALDAIGLAAKDAGVDIYKYVGIDRIHRNKPNLIKHLNEALTGDGTASLDELDAYAKSVSLEKTKELLYDASNRSNLEDAMRIIAPFASAWREIVGTHGHLFREAPLNYIRGAQRTYTGASQADPDNDGRGFFFNDPVTDTMMFMFPASGGLAKAITGLDAPLKAPVGRLSQGLQVYPALGPFLQLVASKIIPDTPKTDWVVEKLLPYGRKDFSSTAGQLIPGWVQKLSEALRRDEGKMDTVYANTYVETLRALSASGKYELNNPEDVKHLQSDAKGKAQWLTAFRALSQFVGPTAGATEFKIDTKDGDIFVGELIKEFYALQADNYDTAVETFLAQFGDDVSLYVSSKSKSTVQGLEATEQFGDFERGNENLFKDFPDVAAYLAPSGDDFSFAVWERQIRAGKRERLTDKEMIDLAQERIGASKYRWARKQVGSFPNDNSRNILRQYRTYLHEQFPGFPLVAKFTVGEYDFQIEQMRAMVADPQVQGNEVAQSIRTYIQFRDAAKQAALAQFGSDNITQSKQTQYLRDKLANIGEVLISENPNFGRVWQRFLSHEVEE